MSYFCKFIGSTLIALSFSVAIVDSLSTPASAQNYNRSQILSNEAKQKAASGLKTVGVHINGVVPTAALGARVGSAAGGLVGPLGAGLGGIVGATVGAAATCGNCHPINKTKPVITKKPKVAKPALTPSEMRQINSVLNNKR
jgi:cytochrome c553